MDVPIETSDKRPPPRQAPWEILLVFTKIGALSYGGAAIMGIMQAEIQQRRAWLSKERYLEGMALIHMLPGAPATQLAIFLGHHRGGFAGGVLAGLGFVLPAFFIMLGLAVLYTTYGALPIMRHAFYGLGPVVLGIFLVAVFRLGRAALTDAWQVAIALAAALFVAFTPIGIAGTLVLAGCAGVAVYHACRKGLLAMLGAAFLIAAWHWIGAVLTAPVASAPTPHGPPPGLLDMAWFFFTAGAFTFGGGITIIAFVQDQVVNQLQWLTPQEFLDGLALGQLTPGPVVMLAAYVGYKLAGVTGAAVGAFCIFLPSFVVILSVLPVVNRFRNIVWIKSVMKAIGPAVIGVLCVSLLHLAPHAVSDAFTGSLLALTIAAMLYWQLAPLPLVFAGGGAGILARLAPLQRLKDAVM